MLSELTPGGSCATMDTIALNTSDDGLGMPLVFLHGFPFNHGVWQKQIDVFQSFYRVIAPDLSGFGGSESRIGPATMEHHASDVHALLQRLTPEPVVLVGHSMGGYVALAFARQFPEMLRGLVLVGTKADADTPDEAAGRQGMAEKVKTEGVQALIEAMAPKMLAASNQDARAMELVQGLMASSKPEGTIGALLGMAERPDATAHLSQIVVPTLVIAGANDTVIPPAESAKLAQGIPGAQLKSIPLAGHLVAFEQHGEFNRILKEWLSVSHLKI